MVVLQAGEPFSPNITDRIEQPPPAFVDHGGTGTASVAEAACVETVLIFANSLGIAYGRSKVLDPHETQTFGAEIREIPFVEKAKSAGEPEVPSEAGSVGLVAIPASLRGRRVPPGDSFIGWERAQRKDLHTWPGFHRLEPGPAALHLASKGSLLQNASEFPLPPRPAAFVEGKASFGPLPADSDPWQRGSIRGAARSTDCQWLLRAE